MSGGATAEDNASLAEQWIARIQAAVHKDVPGKRGPSVARRLYVLVNPRSGPGKALQIWQKDLLPLLQEAGVSATLVITEKEGHATELVQSIAVEDWDGLIIVSGDGLLYEVINGIMLRPDRAHVLNSLPIGVVPGGSGNGIAATLCYEESLPLAHWLQSRSLAAAVPTSLLPLPLITVQTPHSTSYAFLSLNWGLLADIDIESEKFRRTLGSARFAVGAVQRILFNMKSYRGRVSWLPADDVSHVLGPDGRPLPPATNTRSVADRSVSECEGALPPTKTTAFTSGAMSKSLGDLNVRRSVSESPTTPDEESLPTTRPPCKVQFPKRLGKRDGQNNRLPEGASTSAERRAEVGVEEELPSDWVVEEDEFLFVMVVFASHLSAVLPFMPRMRLGDDVMYLTLLRGGRLGKAAALKMLIGFEHATHLENPEIEVYPIRGIRIQTLGNGGTIAVDENSSRLKSSKPLPRHSEPRCSPGRIPECIILRLLCP